MKKELLDEGGPAFPVAADLSTDYACDPLTGRANGFHAGMTLRDYFAAKAMAALIAATEADAFVDARQYAEVLSTGAYGYADAMLRARED